ncbi:MAG: hypothetical protein M3N82_06270, partial [Pseudomonadota bacterium]|nr:hypothetical protein [Pseudomonadota bacterium]
MAEHEGLAQDRPPATGASFAGRHLPTFLAMPTPSPSILVLNGGSSSIRFAVLRADDGLTRVCSGTLERIGHDDAHLAIDDLPPAEARQAIAARDPGEAVRALVQWLRQRGEADSLVAVGHRVVNGMDHFDPER